MISPLHVSQNLHFPLEISAAYNTILVSVSSAKDTLFQFDVTHTFICTYVRLLHAEPALSSREKYWISSFEIEKTHLVLAFGTGKHTVEREQQVVLHI